MTNNNTAAAEHAGSFWIFGLDPAGLEVVFRSAHPITAFSRTLYVGDVMEITPEILELNEDRDGETFLRYTAEDQTRVWRRQRFGIGEPPESVLQARRDAELARIAEERNFLRQANPAAARAAGVAKRLREFDEVLSK